MHDLMAVPSSIASLRYLRSEVERAGSGGEIVTHTPPPGQRCGPTRDVPRQVMLRTRSGWRITSCCPKAIEQPMGY